MLLLALKNRSIFVRSFYWYPLCLREWDGTQPSIATALGQYSLQYRAIFCSSMMSDRL